jgi:hypothetical protein
MPEWSNDGDPLADLIAALEQLERQSREPLRPVEPDAQLEALAEAFAARHGYSRPPRPAPAELAFSLRFAIESGIMSEGQARDVDATADGLVARMRAGEITEEQGLELAGAAAVRDGQAVNRARARAAGGNRAARRAEAAEQRRARRK